MKKPKQKSQPKAFYAGMNFTQPKKPNAGSYAGQHIAKTEKRK
jgi:hypothetical protein